MEFLFLSCYDYFKKRKALLFSLFVAVLLLMGWGASRIVIEEDISRFFPSDKKLAKVNQVFRNSRLAERLVVMVSLNDSTATPDPDKLIGFADSLAHQLDHGLTPYIKNISLEVSDAVALQLFGSIYDNLPVFLTDKDFVTLDSITQPSVIKATMENNYHQLISPTGFVTKRIIVKDPVGISQLVFKKLQGMQYDQSFELYQNHIFTKDKTHLLFFVEPAFPANDTGDNVVFLNGFDKIKTQVSVSQPGVHATYFGAAAVAAGNAVQLNKDTVLTVSITIILLMVFLIGFLRKVSAPFIIMIPVVFGVILAMAAIQIIQGSISVLAIAAGSIILGIAINYSLHFLSHLKHTFNVREVVKDLVQPMILGSTTTVLAFFSLQFANASMLSDIGLFAGFSLIGAALCSLIFLPHMVSDHFFNKESANKSWSFASITLPRRFNRILIIIILLLTPVMFYFGSGVSFNSDMNKLNFMSTEMKSAESELNHLTRFSSQTVYVVADGRNLEEALQYNERLQPELEDMKRQGIIRKYSSVSTFIVSDSLQRLRIERWNKFWTPAKKAAVMTQLEAELKRLKFTQSVYYNFDSLVNRSYHPAGVEGFRLFRENFFGDYITEKDSLTTVVTLATADPARTAEVYSHFKNNANHVEAVDKRMLTNMFVSHVHADFTFIVTFTSIMVFVVLLISYGRIELALITFIPMLMTWIWILGAMALLGIEFNIVNVMISTFIFGLGDDYSIFIMDGMLTEYKTGHRTMGSIRDSIFLSAITTISGLGVLIFASHPALKSIAAISIIGIITVVIMSQTIEPLLFNRLITRRVKKTWPPATAWGVFKTLLIYLAFVVGGWLLAVIGFITLRLNPFAGKRTQYFYHTLLKYFTRAPIYMGVLSPKIFIGNEGQYETPRIMISNHQSFVDILLCTMRSARVILLTNRWVWNSPLFGWVVKLGGYYPVDFGVEGSVEKLQKRVNEGYSIVVFPEGTRSPNQELQRFHKGAFYLSEKLNLDIQPVLLHGTGEAIPKGDFYIQDTEFTMKYLPPIAHDDVRFGTTYAEKAKKVGQYFKREYAKLKDEIERPIHFKFRLFSTFIYKGPTLEWYMRIKVRMEDYYASYNFLTPKNATVLDLGCGYGFLSYILHFVSAERRITGVDFDEEKITVAAHGYSRGETLQFVCADITKYSFEPHDVIFLSDVLHYLTGEQQHDLLMRCFAGLKPGGVLILRDGDSDLQKQHRMTELTELFSIRLLGFNKSSQAPNYISGERIRKLCAANGMTIEVISSQKFTSNVIFAIRKGHS